MGSGDPPETMRMKYKTLGKTGEKLPAIGQGTMGVGGYLTEDASHDDDQIKALQLGIELGMTLIDTAEGYGAGHAEDVLGRAIKGQRDRIFIATKFAPEHNGYNGVLAAVEASLKRLGVDRIDLYQMHWPTPNIPIEETVRALQKLQKDGKIRFVGVCNLSMKEIKEFRALMAPDDIVSLQVEYNLFDRTIEQTVLPYCEETGLTVIAYSPLDQGKAVGGAGARVLADIATKYGKMPSQIALNWLVSRRGIIAIPKAMSLEHVAANASATDFELTADDYSAIDKAFGSATVALATDRICVVPDGQGSRPAYRTLEEALANPLGFVPSPAELAKDIKTGEPVKPVRVVRRRPPAGGYEYDLVEGRVRYWAWVIAYNGKKPVPALVREN